MNCIPLVANFEYCIECDMITAFNEDPAMCCICGSHHPLADWYDETIPIEEWDNLKYEVLGLISPD